MGSNQQVTGCCNSHVDNALKKYLALQRDNRLTVKICKTCYTCKKLPKCQCCQYNECFTAEM